jgi:hypothetical protein
MSYRRSALQRIYQPKPQEQVRVIVPILQNKDKEEEVKKQSRMKSAMVKNIIDYAQQIPWSNLGTRSKNTTISREAAAIHYSETRSVFDEIASHSDKPPKLIDLSPSDLLFPKEEELTVDPATTSVLPRTDSEENDLQFIYVSDSNGKKCEWPTEIHVPSTTMEFSQRPSSARCGAPIDSAPFLSPSLPEYPILEKTQVQRKLHSKFFSSPQILQGKESVFSGLFLSRANLLHAERVQTAVRPVSQISGSELRMHISRPHTARGQLEGIKVKYEETHQRIRPRSSKFIKGKIDVDKTFLEKIKDQLPPHKWMLSEKEAVALLLQEDF